MISTPDPVGTIEELVEHLKIAKSTLYKFAQQGPIPVQKVGRDWRFRKVAVGRRLERSGG